jgi:nitroreductase
LAAKAVMGHLDTIAQNIRQRRTTTPEEMNGKLIDDAVIFQLLELARWAPTHGLTEPWRFSVFSGVGKAWFAREHARLFWENTPDHILKQDKYNKILHRADKASHVIAIGVKCGTKATVPDIEEIAAVSCAVHNMFLGATALGIAAYWGSGGMTYHSAMREWLGLEEQDKVLGFLYLGYNDRPHPEGRREDILAKTRFISKPG